MKKSIDIPDDLLTPTAAANLIGCSSDRVKQLSDKGIIPVIKTSTGRRLYRRSDVIEFINSETQKGK